ncbi:MAG TPA: hypothetical protein VMR77_03690 [Patescibacteria group bacterium]|jgi:ABC-type Fe3+-hydroxamate transport system substrate-binding protein|nr:hypothetical protein [Patescibacteria group bacterium]
MQVLEWFLMETRNDRFKRLGLKRTNEVLEKIRILGNLSNKSSYDYSDQEVDSIFKAIEDQVRTVKARFKSRKKQFKF